MKTTHPSISIQLITHSTKFVLDVGHGKLWRGFCGIATVGSGVVAVVVAVVAVVDVAVAVQAVVVAVVVVVVVVVVAEAASNVAEFAFNAIEEVFKISGKLLPKIRNTKNRHQNIFRTT